MFRDALTWLDVHGRAPQLVDHWAGIVAAAPASHPPGADLDGELPPFRRRRRRRRRRHFVPNP
jgi:hypothetical protein